MQYIYISREEMEAVAEYIKRRGRIAIGELAAKSNIFVDLEAKAATVSLKDEHMKSSIWQRKLNITLVGCHLAATSVMLTSADSTVSASC